MKRLFSLAILAAALVYSAAAQTVNISVPALDATGAAVTSGVAYIDWNRFTTDNGTIIYGSSMTVPITGGILAVTLYSSDTNGYDSGYVYNVLIEGNGLNSTYKWKVPATGATTMAQLNQPTADGFGGSAATLIPLGNDRRAVTTNGKGAPGDCVAFDATGYNVTDAGSPCTAGGLAIPTQSGLAKMTASSKTLTPAVPGTDYQTPIPNNTYDAYGAAAAITLSSLGAQNANLPNARNLPLPTFTGIPKLSSGSNALAPAIAGTDFQAPIPNNTYDAYGAAAAITLSSLGAQNASLPNTQNLTVPTFTGIPKLTSGSNTPGQAVAGTDYLQPSSLVPASRAVSLLGVASLGTKPAGSGITPTITYQSSDTIASSQRFNACGTVCPDTTHFRFASGKYLQAGAQSPRSNGVINVINAETNGGSPNIMETLIDSSQFEYLFVGGAQTMRFYLDGVQVLTVGPDMTTGTAQAGAASTITLASGASATSGAYNTMYVYITGGTGSGQYRQITSYVGSTKVATVSAAWTTTPDATSTYRVNVIGDPNSFGVPNDGSGHYIDFSFGGVRATRRLKIISGGYLYAVIVDQSGSLSVPPTNYSTICFNIGDSFTEGTNAVFGNADNFASVLSNMLGWEPWNLGQGGTGAVNNDSGIRLPYAGRVLPPVNSWIINTEPLTAAGAFTLTQGSTTTGSIATTATVATLQAALNTAFGAGAFYATAHPYYGYVIEGQGATASITTPMKVTQTGGSGTMTIFQYLGDIAPYVPVDGNGNSKPFIIFIEGSGNDDNQTGVQAAVSSLYSGIAAKWPQAIIIASGRWMNLGPENSTANATDQAYAAAAAASLPKINGHSAFIDLFNNSTGVGYLNCQTSVESPTGVSGCSTDYYVSWDGTHPTTPGYNFLSNQLLTPILNIFAN